MRFITTPEYRVSIAMRCNLHYTNPNEVKTRERGGGVTLITPKECDVMYLMPLLHPSFVGRAIRTSNPRQEQ